MPAPVENTGSKTRAERAPASVASAMLVSGAVVVVTSLTLGASLFAVALVGVIAVTSAIAGFAIVGRFTSRLAEDRQLVERALEDGDPDLLIRFRDVRYPTREIAAAAVALIERCRAAETRSRALGSAAESADRERLAFLADFSHGLRTPLNAILGFSHILENESEGPLDADGQEAVRVIRTSGEHLRTLVEDILDLTALLSGELRLAPEPVDVFEVAAEIAGVISPCGPPVECRGDPGAVLVGDPGRLRRVLWNIMARAVRVSPNGPVEVRVVGANGEVTVGISDAGRAIDPGELTALAGEAELDTVLAKGSGVGLAVAGQLVRRMGGAASAESLDRGTRVAIHIASISTDRGSESDE